MKKTVIAIACLIAGISTTKAVDLLDATFQQSGPGNWYFLAYVDTPNDHFGDIYVDGFKISGGGGDIAFDDGFGNPFPLPKIAPGWLSPGDHTMEWIAGDVPDYHLFAYYTIIQPTGPHPFDDVSTTPDGGSTFAMALAGIGVLCAHRRRAFFGLE